MQAVGLGLPPSASMVADRFLVCFKLPLQVYCLVFAFALFGFGFGLLCCLLFLASFGLSGLVSVALHSSVFGWVLLVSAFISSSASNI